MRHVVVIPAFNESASVGEVVAECRALGHPVCVVDDGSTDDTWAVARAAGASALRLPINVGVGGALRTGFAWAVENGYARVIQLDADGQHDTASIAGLIDAADAGAADLVVGSRFADGYRTSPARRRVMGLLAAMVSRRVGVQMDDVTSGFRVISEPLLSRFAADYPTEFLSDTIEAILAAAAAGAVIAQAPASMRARRAGSATSRAVAFGHLLRVLFAIAVKRAS